MVSDKMNDNTSADGCQMLLKHWLAQCGKHLDCSVSQQSFLPTRLLDLENVHVDGQVRLVISRDIVKKVRYVTLSHCWGGDVPFQLRETTMERMMSGFALREMPKTFQDAVAVARWVDGKFPPIYSTTVSSTKDLFYQFATFGSTHAASYKAQHPTGQGRPRRWGRCTSTRTSTSQQTTP